MPELREVITSESVQGLHEAFQAGLLVLEQKAEENKSVRAWLGRDDGDVSEAMLRYVHNRLMASAVRDHEAPNPEFPYRASITIKSLFPEGTRYEAVTGQLGRMLYLSGLAWKPGRGKWTLWVRHWPQGLKPVIYVSTHEPMDWRTEAAIEREAQVERPVIVTRDLRAIKAPEMTPESIQDWVARFIPAALAIQDEREALRARVAELEEALAAVEEAKNGSAWAAVGEAIKEAVDG